MGASPLRALNSLKFPVQFAAPIGRGIGPVEQGGHSALFKSGVDLLEADDDEAGLVRQR